MLQRGQGKLVKRVIASLVLNAKCLTPIRNYHARQSEVEYRLAFRNSLHIASIKRFHKESVNCVYFTLPLLVSCEHSVFFCSATFNRPARRECDDDAVAVTLKMHDLKMTDKNYGVWKMQEYKSS